MCVKKTEKGSEICLKTQKLIISFALLLLYACEKEQAAGPIGQHRSCTVDTSYLSFQQNRLLRIEDKHGKWAFRYPHPDTTVAYHSDSHNQIISNESHWFIFKNGLIDHRIDSSRELSLNAHDTTIAVWLSEYELAQGRVVKISKWELFEGNKVDEFVRRFDYDSAGNIISQESYQENLPHSQLYKSYQYSALANTSPTPSEVNHPIIPLASNQLPAQASWTLHLPTTEMEQSISYRFDAQQRISERESIFTKDGQFDYCRREIFVYQ